MTVLYPTRLKEILETEGRYQTWLARQLDPPVSRSVVCEWASGSLIVAHDRQVQIAAALGRNVDDVFPQTERSAAA